MIGTLSHIITGTRPAGRGMAAVAVDGPLVYSDDEVWCYWRLATTSTTWLTTEKRRAFVAGLAAGLGDFAEEQLHLLVVHRRVDPTAWAADLDAATGDAQPGWAAYLADQADALSGYTTKQAFLGVRLGRRADVTSPWRWTTRRTLDAAGLADPHPPGREADRWREEARRRDHTMAAHAWRGRPATAEELAWLIGRTVWRGIDEPPTPAPAQRWGHGDLRLLGESVIDNTDPRRVVVSQPSGQAHLAAVSLARFPQAMHRPGWLAQLDQASFDIDLSMRMHVQPASAALTELRKRLADIRDQQTHLSEARNYDGVTEDTRAQAEALQLYLEAEGTPLVDASTVLHIAGTTKAQLDARVNEVKSLMNQRSIDTVVAAGNQLDLLWESMPGDTLRVKSYVQKHDPLTIAGALATSTTELGDVAGAVNSRGEPIVPGLVFADAIEEAARPVHLDLHNLAQIDTGPSVALTGKTGGGKSVAMMLLAYHTALRGARCLVIDPKGDAAKLTNLSGVDVTSIPIRGEQAPGLLDPYRIHSGDPARASVLAHSVLTSVLPAKQAHDAEAVLLRVCEQVAASRERSMARLVDVLADHPDADARDVGDTIAAMAGMDKGQLIFGQPSRDSGLTYEGLARLDQPGIQIIDVAWLHEMAAGDHTGPTTLGERLATAVFHLIVVLCQELADHQAATTPAAIAIDEAHRLARTSQGRRLLTDMTKLGRSRNVAVLLASQNIGDFLAGGEDNLLNNIGVQIAFGVGDPTEAGHVLDALRVGDGDSARQALLRLGRGQALMRDQYQRVGRIQVTPTPDVLTALSTTPDPRRRKTATGAPAAEAPPAETPAGVLESSFFKTGPEDTA